MLIDVFLLNSLPFTTTTKLRAEWSSFVANGFYSLQTSLILVFLLRVNNRRWRQLAEQEFENVATDVEPFERGEEIGKNYEEAFAKSTDISKPSSQVVGISVDDTETLSKIYLKTNELVTSCRIDWRMIIPRARLPTTKVMLIGFHNLIRADIQQRRLVLQLIKDNIECRPVRRFLIKLNVEDWRLARDRFVSIFFWHEALIVNKHLNLALSDIFYLFF